MRRTVLRYRCAPNFKVEDNAIYRSIIAVKPTPIVAMAILMAICCVNLNKVSGQVQERVRWLLPDVAKVTLDASGQSQIDFNPTICRRLGPDLCEYFRAHEYGHVNLRHLERGVPTRQAEREADIWAAQNASPSAVKAAREYFEKGKGGSRLHGSARERAQRLKEFQTGKTSEYSLQKRVTYLKPIVSSTAKTTSTATQTPYQLSSKSRTAAVVPTITYHTRGRITTTPTTTRAPIQYSAGSRKTVVRKVVPQRTKIVVGTTRSTSNSPRSYYQQGYVPKGGFNNPSR